MLQFSCKCSTEVYGCCKKSMKHSPMFLTPVHLRTVLHSGLQIVHSGLVVVQSGL